LTAIAPKLDWQDHPLFKLGLNWGMNWGMNWGIVINLQIICFLYTIRWNKIKITQ